MTITLAEKENQFQQQVVIVVFYLLVCVPQCYAKFLKWITIFL